MAKTIQLDIVTPDKTVFSQAINMVIARTTDGDIGVLPGHIPLIAGLQIWPLRVLTDEGEKEIALCGGFIEVQPEKVTILAPCAEMPENIDVARAQAARERAEIRLKTAPADMDMERAELALKRAMMRLKVAEDSKRFM